MSGTSLPGSDVFVNPFKEKTILVFDLTKKFVSRLLISDPLFVAAKTRSIANLKLKS